MHLHEITFPIFELYGDYNYYIEDNILYAQRRDKTLIVDNKNINEKTLGKRRLQIRENKLSVNRVYYSVKELLTCKHNFRIFLDNYGNIFEYNRKHFVPLVCHKIISYKLVENYGILIRVSKCNERFLLSGATNMQYYKYARILHTRCGYIFYDLVHKYCKNSKRLI